MSGSLSDWARPHCLLWACAGWVCCEGTLLPTWGVASTSFCLPVVPEASFYPFGQAVGQGQCKLGKGSASSSQTTATSYLQDALFPAPLLLLRLLALAPRGQCACMCVCACTRVWKVPCRVPWELMGEVCMSLLSGVASIWELGSAPQPHPSGEWEEGRLRPD